MLVGTCAYFLVQIITNEAGAQTDPLRDRAVLLLLLGKEHLGAEGLVGRLRRGKGQEPGDVSDRSGAWGNVPGLHTGRYQSHPPHDCGSKRNAQHVVRHNVRLKAERAARSVQHVVRHNVRLKAERAGRSVAHQHTHHFTTTISTEAPWSQSEFFGGLRFQTRRLAVVLLVWPDQVKVER